VLCMLCVVGFRAHWCATMVTCRAATSHAELQCPANNTCKHTAKTPGRLAPGPAQEHCAGAPWQDTPWALALLPKERQKERALTTPNDSHAASNSHNTSASHEAAHRHSPAAAAVDTRRSGLTR
jgi:hypothetical protein